MYSTYDKAVVVGLNKFDLFSDIYLKKEYVYNVYIFRIKKKKLKNYRKFIEQYFVLKSYFGNLKANENFPIAEC